MIIIELEEKNSSAILHISGAFTAEDLNSFEMSWNEAVSHKPEAMALDIAQLKSLDSMALSRTMSLFENAKRKKIILFAFGISPKVQEVFGAIKLDRLITYIAEKKFVEQYFY